MVRVGSLSRGGGGNRTGEKSNNASSIGIRNRTDLQGKVRHACSCVKPPVCITADLSIMYKALPVARTLQLGAGTLWSAEARHIMQCQLIKCTVVYYIVCHYAFIICKYEGFAASGITMPATAEKAMSRLSHVLLIGLSWPVCTEVYKIFSLLLNVGT